MSSDIYLNGITYPADRNVAFPGKDGKPVVFSLPEDADKDLNPYSERPVQNKVIHAAIQDVRQRQTSPYNFKGAVATLADLPSTGQEVNDTYYVEALKYRVTWTGSAWQQSSMEESKYADELAVLKNDIAWVIEHPGDTDYAFSYGFETGALTEQGTVDDTYTNMKTITGYIPIQPDERIRIDTNISSDIYTLTIVWYTSGKEVLAYSRNDTAPHDYYTAIWNAFFVRLSLSDAVLEKGVHIYVENESRLNYLDYNREPTKNLIGNTPYEYYPVDFKEGDSIVFSRADGSVAPANMDVNFYDDGLNLITTYAAVVRNHTYRIIDITAKTAATKYLRLKDKSKFDVPLMCTYGKTPAKYRPYESRQDESIYNDSDSTKYSGLRYATINDYGDIIVANGGPERIVSKDLIPIDSLSHIKINRAGLFVSIIGYNEDGKLCGYCRLGNTERKHILSKNVIVDIISKTYYRGGPNNLQLLGPWQSELYPVEFNIGNKIVFSTYNGSTVSEHVPALYLYDENKEQVDSLTPILQGNSSRVITISERAARAKYISPSANYNPKIMLAYGDTPVSYQNYVYDGPVKYVRVFFRNADDTIPVTDEDFDAVEVRLHKSSVYSTDEFCANGNVYQLYNPYKVSGSLRLKGQMHCHTTNSDGRNTPLEVCDMYYNKGYDFITITDHNYITPEPEGNKLIWLCNSMEETHNSQGYQHMNIFNVDKRPRYSGSRYIDSANIDSMIRDCGIGGDSLVQLNHPDDPMPNITGEMLSIVPQGLNLVEIFNGVSFNYMGDVATYTDLPMNYAGYGMVFKTLDTGKYYCYYGAAPGVPGNWKESGPPELYPKDNYWSIFDNNRVPVALLDAGHKVFLMGTDDYHLGNMLDRGWIVVFAESRVPASIFSAISRGCFYASNGAEIDSIDIVDGCYKIHIPDGGDCVTRFYGKGNEVLKEMAGADPYYQLTGEEMYVRAEVNKPISTPFMGYLKAWTQPLWIIGKRKVYMFSESCNQ